MTGTNIQSNLFDGEETEELDHVQRDIRISTTRIQRGCSTDEGGEVLARLDANCSEQSLRALRTGRHAPGEENEGGIAEERSGGEVEVYSENNMARLSFMWYMCEMRNLYLNKSG